MNNKPDQPIPTMIKTSIRYFLISALFTLSSISHAMISIDVLSKMEKEYDFQTNSVIQRMINTQQSKIDNGSMTPFEARCIAINTVDMLGLTNADRFIRITEQAFEGQSPSLNDENFITEISNRYLSYMQLIAVQCSKEDPDNQTKEIEKNRSTDESETPSIPQGFSLISPNKETDTDNDDNHNREKSVSTPHKENNSHE